jgi:hypothetical protein
VTTDGADIIPGGFVLLARKLLESELMDKPPLYSKLWQWLILRAEWRKDAGKIARGQLVTTIAEMQDAMSYRVGYRKITPTKDAVRSAYEAFVKATMITTAKTTRGMIITIQNYELYQNSKNYGPHGEPHGEDAPKPAVTPQGSKDVKEKKNKPMLAKIPPAESRLFSSWFCYAFEIIQGYPYNFEGGKDGKILTGMMKKNPCKELVAKACHFLTDENRFPKNKAPTLSFFAMKINDYPNHINGEAEHLRAIGIIPPDGIFLEDWQPWKAESRHSA